MIQRLIYIAVILFINNICKASPQTSTLITRQSHASPANRGLATYQDYDIIFHTSVSNQSLAVQQATTSTFSHMGIIIYRDGKPYVFEAVSSVQYTPLSDWKARGARGGYVVKRLKNVDTLRTTQATHKAAKLMKAYENKPYDLTFEWSDDRLYCSELVWKIYDRAFDIQLAPLAKLEDFNLSSTAVKNKLKERYGDKIPYEEKVISPQAIFDSSMLQTVESHR